MKVVLTAGGIPQPGDPLYDISRGMPKALVPIAGKPIIQWVLDALNVCTIVDEIALVGLENGDGLTCVHPIHFLQNTGELIDNISSGLRLFYDQGERNRPVFIVASDLPAVSASMIHWMATMLEDNPVDVYYPVITRQTMEARFPGSNRTYLRLKDYEVCGGDVLMVMPDLICRKSDLWKRIGDARKSPRKQAAMLGLDTLLLILTRSMTLKQTEKQVSKRMGVRGRALLCPFAEMGMDIDKPHQYTLLEKDFSLRLGTDANDD